MQSPDIWLQSNMKEAALTVAASESLLGYGRAPFSEGSSQRRDFCIEKVVHGCIDAFLVIGIAGDSADLLNDNAAEAYWRCQYKRIECRKINALPGYLGHGQQHEMWCCSKLLSDCVPFCGLLSAVQLKDGEGGVGKQGVEGSEVFASFH